MSVEEICAAQLNEINEVVELIVGTAEFATATFGGRWVQFLRYAPGKTYPSYGYIYDEETDDFIIPDYLIVHP